MEKLDYETKANSYNDFNETYYYVDDNESLTFRNDCTYRSL